MLTFDIGCNTGMWTEANWNKDDLFVCVDALPAAYIAASERFWGKWNVQVINRLVAEQDGFMKMFYTSPISSGEVSTASPEWVERSRHDGHWDNGSYIYSVTLDKLISRFGVPDLVKIDVEGYELNVLQGLTQKVPLLCFEFAEEFNKDAMACVDRLHNIGFSQFTKQHGDSYSFRPVSFIDYRGIVRELKSDLVPERAEAWGMIWAK